MIGLMIQKPAFARLSATSRSDTRPDKLALGSTRGPQDPSRSQKLAGLNEIGLPTHSEIVYRTGLTHPTRSLQEGREIRSV